MSLQAGVLMAGELPDPVDIAALSTASAKALTLGRDLVFDPILSGNQNIAYATCHHPSMGCSDAMSLSRHLGKMPEQQQGNIKMTSKTSTGNTGAAEVGTEVNIVLNQEILSGMRKQVAFETQADVQELVADAINSYLHLGNLDASGMRILAQNGTDGELMHLRFPFNG